MSHKVLAEQASADRQRAAEVKFFCLFGRLRPTAHRFGSFGWFRLTSQTFEQAKFFTSSFSSKLTNVKKRDSSCDFSAGLSCFSNSLFFDIAFGPKNLAALMAVILYAIAFFRFRFAYKYVLFATLLLGLLGFINFLPIDFGFSFRFGEVGIGQKFLFIFLLSE